MDLLSWPAAPVALLAHVVARLRGGRAALHPRGTVLACTVRVSGGLGTGSDLLDRPAHHAGVVRLSRSAGLPPPLPDVGGVALRLPGHGVGGGPFDLLLSTAWRWVFVPSALSRTCSSLVPFRTATGRHLLLGARPDGDGWRLLLATPLGPWQEWGRLVVGAATAEQDLRTDPVAGTPDLAHPRVLRRLRATSYAASQRARRPDQPDNDPAWSGTWRWDSRGGRT